VNIYTQLKKQTDSKIVLLVADGLGGLPLSPDGKTELETAHKPNLDKLAKENICGLITPVLPGIAPGSGPGHLGLFGYDPLQYKAGRGLLETLGTDFKLQHNDITARGNFCTVDANGKITDRRAGRISTEVCKKLVDKLKEIRLSGADIFVEPVQDYRFALIIRGADLDGEVEDTDPQTAGVPPLKAKSKNKQSEKTAEIINEFVSQAKEILKNDHPANMITFRGIGKKPNIPTMKEAYGLNAAATCVYPMYRGVAKLVGMTILPAVKNIQEQIGMLRKNWDDFDFFFVHYKYTDSTGEDGNFDGKVKHIEIIDSYIPQIMDLKPDVLVVTGDHSTPAALKAHSWHPVPTLLAAKTCRPDNAKSFGERECLNGAIGQIQSKYLLPLALAHAGKLEKYGA